MSGRDMWDGSDASADVADRVSARLAAFEDRMHRLEEGLTAQVDRVRDSAQAIDVLTDEVRRSLQSWHDDGTVGARLSAIEALLEQPRSAPEAPAADLTPVTSALAEVLDAVALQSETAARDRRALQDEIETLRSEIGRIPGPPDLTTLEQRVNGLAEAVAEQRPEPVDLSGVHEHLAELADHVTASMPRPVELSGVTSSIVGLHQRIDALGESSAVDLTPVLERLQALSDDVAAQRPDPVDLTPVTAAVADLRTHVADSRPDLHPLLTRLDELARRADQDPVREHLDELGRRIDAVGSSVDLTPIQHAMAEVVDALAHQIDDSRTSAANVLAAIEVLADRVRENRIDLEPLVDRLSSLADAAQVDALRDRIDDLTGTVADHRTEPVDLGPVTAAIADLRTHIADSRPDLLPLQTRLDGLAAVVDTSTIRDRIDDLAGSLESLGSTLDLGPIRSGIAEVVEAAAIQLETTERTAAELRTAVSAAAEGSTVDLAPVVSAVEALRQHYDSTQPDLDVLVEAMKALRSQIITGVHEAAEANRVDLQPVVDRLDVQQTGQQSAFDQLREDLGRLDLRAVEDRLDALASATPTVDIEPVLRAVTELHNSLPQAPDLAPLHQAIADLTHAIPPATDLGPMREDLASMRDAVGALDLAAVHDRIDRLREAMPELNLAPFLAAVDSVREDLPTIELDPVLRAIEAVRGDLPTIDLDPVLRAIETVHGDLPTIDLDPVLRAIETVHGDLPTIDLAPVLDAVESVRRDLPEIDLARLHAAIADVSSKVDAIDVEVDLEPVLEDIGTVRAAVREAQTDLTPVLDALSDLGRRVDDTSEVERLRAAVDRVADDLAGARAESARADMIDQLAQRLDALQSAVESIRADDALRDTELRLLHRVDANSESLRAKIDDQRALADSLAANVSQLNAALTLASEQPQQLRRDLDRTLEQLAERLGGAMRELRKELDAVDEPLALRSSVEAGLDRITGRFQTDTGRILEAVAAAQEDADGRLRRIDNQMTELRRAVERARRESERFESPSPS